MTNSARVSRDIGITIKSLANPVPFRRSDNEIWLFFAASRLSGWATCEIELMRSFDNGVTWGPAERIYASPFFNLSHLTKSTPFLFSDGRIGLPVYQEISQKFPGSPSPQPGGASHRPATHGTRRKDRASTYDRSDRAFDCYRVRAAAQEPEKHENTFVAARKTAVRLGRLQRRSICQIPVDRSPRSGTMRTHILMAFNDDPKTEGISRLRLPTSKERLSSVSESSRRWLAARRNTPSRIRF